MKMLKRVLLGLVPVVFLMLFAGVAVALPPRITWTPNPLVTESIAPGESATYTVTFKNTGYLPIPVTNQLRVVPEGAIAPYVTVVPPKFPSVVKPGQSVTFDVAVTVPGDAPVGVSDGTLVLKRVLPNGKVKEVWRAEALAVEMTIEWPRPVVTWEPTSLLVDVIAGQSTTTTASFSMSENAGDITVQVAPELASFVAVSPSFIFDVMKGETYDVSVKIAATSGSPLDVHDVAIHILQGTTTLRDSLTIAINITEGPVRFFHPNNFYSVDIPNGYYQEYDPLRDKLFISSSPDTNRLSPFISLSVVSNPDSLSVLDFFDGDPGTNLLGASSNSYSTTTVSGIESYVFVPYQTLSGGVTYVIPWGIVFVVINDLAGDIGDATASAILNSLIIGG